MQTRTDRQSLRPKSVTHVSGMKRYPCVRNGPCLAGGEGGIRTPDTVARMPHFECGAFNHSATSPLGRARAPKYLANAAERNKVRPSWPVVHRSLRPAFPFFCRVADALHEFGEKACGQPPGTAARHPFLGSLPVSLPFCRLVKRALPSPVPIVNAPQRLTSRMKGTSLRPCTTASL